MTRLRIVRTLLLSLALVLTISVGTASAQDANTVDVELGEFYIEMPESLPSGPTSFVVTNVGEMVHTITITGGDIDITLEPTLSSGESGTLDVDLAPGTYTVICPIPGHAEAGMQLTLTVTEAEDGATPTEEAVETPTEEAEAAPTEEAEGTPTGEAEAEPTATSEATPEPDAAATPTVLPGMPNTGAGGSQSPTFSSGMLATLFVLMTVVVVGGALAYRNRSQTS